jgi:hypothetical protein
MSSREINNGVWRRWVRATPSRTTACSRRPTAYATLRLPGAAEAQRSAAPEKEDRPCAYQVHQGAKVRRSLCGSIPSGSL